MPTNQIPRMLNNSVNETHFNFPQQVSLYNGKVRDVYNIADKYLVMITSDRISAFDYILPKTIPYKGQVLNQIAIEFLNATKHIVPNWLLASPDPNVLVGHLCEPYKIEMVIRAYLTGHAWRKYKAGKRILCGVPLPEGLKEHDKLPTPIITPATKAETGHDEDISREEIIAQGIVPEDEYIKLENYTRALFDFGTAYAANRGLILVDTKYEFGKKGNEIYLIDEIHTPDSSRYFYADGYAEKQAKGEQQKQLSKEFVREWLIENGFQGLEGQQMPNIPDEFVHKTSNRYIELFEQITGSKFKKVDNTNILERIEQNVNSFLKEILA